MITKILIAVFCVIVFDVVPALIVSGLLRLIFRKRLSKGWCIAAFILSALSTFIIYDILTGKSASLGFIDYAAHFGVISLVLYDKDADTFFDSEKEIKRKQKLKEDNAHAMHE